MGNGVLATDYAGVANIASVATLSSNADSSKGIASIWFQANNFNGVTNFYNAGGGSSGIHNIGLVNDARMRVLWKNSSGTILVNILSTGPVAVSAGSGAPWNHLLASWDTSVGAQHFYLNDVDVIAVFVNTLGVVDYTLSPHTIGSGGREYNGCLSEVYLNFTEFLDFSLMSNRRLFIDGSGDPVELGSDGSAPTSTSPIMYFPDGDPTTNAGTGGNFAQPGTVAACATVPNTAPTLTPRDIIEIVRDEVDVAKTAETEDDFLRLRLGFAEDFLTDALSKFDEGDFRKTAKGVRKAVKFLELAVEKGFDAATVDDWGDRLCGAIRSIATIEIDAAILRTGDPVKIAEAQDAFADGELEKLFMEFLDAIRDFEKAIKSATVA